MIGVFIQLICIMCALKFTIMFCARAFFIGLLDSYNFCQIFLTIQKTCRFGMNCLPFLLQKPLRVGEMVTKCEAYTHNPTIFFSVFQL